MLAGLSLVAGDRLRRVLRLAKLIRFQGCVAKVLAASYGAPPASGCAVMAIAVEPGSAKPEGRSSATSG